MKRKLIVVIIGLLLVAGVVVVKSKMQAISNLPKPRQPLPTVQTVAADKGVLDVVVHYLGVIEPFSKSDLSARISGNILTIAKREGDFVRQGEVIVVIDDRELVNRRMAVAAEMLAARQRLIGAKSTYETQRSIFERDERLYKAGAISLEALERSRTAFDIARTSLEAYEETVKGLQMNVEVAHTQEGYARITAPFSGVISKRWAEPGDLAVPGKPIVTIEKTDSYKILADVPQEEINSIRPGTPVFLKNGDQKLQATVNRIYPAVGKNMLATVEVITKSAPFNLPSSATVGLDAVIKKVEGLIIPEQAIVKSDKGAFIYLIKDGAVNIKPVRLLGMSSGKACVSGEIQVGDKVAVAQENKLLTLTDGSKVIAVEAGKQ